MKRQILAAFFLAIVATLCGYSCASTDCVDQADIVFLVDSSLSIRQYTYEGDDATDNWELVKLFISELIKNLPVSDDGVRVGVVIFASEVSESNVIFLDNRQTKEELISRVQQLPYLEGNTNTSGALRFTRTRLFTEGRGDRPHVKNIGFLITDGLSNIDSDRTASEAREMKNAGIHLFALGITKYADEAELQEIASDPVSYYFFLAYDFKNLAYLQDQVISHLCTAKAPPPTPCKDSRGDLVLILDTSGSISDKNPKNLTGNYNWELLIDFSIKIIESLDIGENNIRLSVIRFSQKAEVMFNLDEFYDPHDIIDRVSELDYLSGSTNTSGALRTMRTDVFNGLGGDRKDVRNVGIIITDGVSTEAVNETLPEARKVKAAKIRMFAVGLTNDISEKELTEIASTPTNEHFFNRTEIDGVDTLISRLVWSVCHDPCDDTKDNEGTLISGYGTICARHEDGQICESGYQLQWRSYPGHLLIGHNYARLTHIGSAKDCQLACLQDQNCRSVDYVALMQECAVSYITKSEALESFAEDESVDYYEWICVRSANTTGSRDPHDGGYNQNNGIPPVNTGERDIDGVDSPSSNSNSVHIAWALTAQLIMILIQILGL